MTLRVAKKISHGPRQSRRVDRLVKATIVACRAARRRSPRFPRSLLGFRDCYWVDYGDGACRAANLLEWALWFECSPLRLVARTTVGETGVVTAALGIPFPGDDDTLLYGSARKLRPGPYEECARYRTRREALAGHARLVAELRRTVATA